MKYLSLAAMFGCSVFLAACSGGSDEQAENPPAPAKTEAAKPAGLSDPADIALRFLNAFKVKDIDMLKSLSTPIMKMAAWGEDSEQLFKSWGDDVAKWDGKIKEVRYEKGDLGEMAVVYFTDDTTKFNKEIGVDEVVTVSFSHAMGPDWGFETFGSRKREEFLKLSTERIEK